MPRLCAMISIDGVVTSTVLPDRGEVTIGRGSACDLVVPHVSVSRHHATLHMAPLAITDVGSRNGTRVRGISVEPKVANRLAIGEAIQVGDAAILLQPFVADESDDDDLPTLPAESIARMLDIECARSARSRSPFSFITLELADDPETDIHVLLRAILRTSDAIGVEASRSYQVLLLDTPAKQAALAVARMTQLLARHGITARLGAARYPEDGVTADQLAAHAAEQLARPPLEPPSAMDAVRARIAQIANSEVSVLITGETGVGKELCAEMVHRLSARAAKPFVKLNCAAIVESLIESELFGHERGAFTGATTARPGLFEAGDGGTVFLDEIGELPLAVQSKLLRVLEERVVRRIGATDGKTLDVRFICATNRDLADEVDAGRFRRDLYYRINGVTIAVPPLRERRSEIAGLARAFARRARGATAPVVLEAEVVAVLEHHQWPGNIRELRNTIERAMLLSAGGEVQPDHLALEPPRPRRDSNVTMPVERVSSVDMFTRPSPPSLANAVAELERQRIIETLNACAGNQTRAARALGISRNTLLARLDAYGFPRPRKA
ncbi:MAG: sigma 54-interacting transcriptional regulator [Kofleriaceae bacterium]